MLELSFDFAEFFEFVIWLTAVNMVASSSSVKNKKISSSAPGLSVMTPCECCVDRLFPVTWLGNVWESFPPPPAVQAWADYLTLAF